MPKPRQFSRKRRNSLAAAFLTVWTIGLGTSVLRSAEAAAQLVAPTITSAPSATSVSTSRTATFAYSDAATVTFRCSLDAAAYVACPAVAAKTGSITYTGLTDGSHTFRVLAVSGTIQTSPTSLTWSIDATPPAVVSIVRLDQNPHAFGVVRWQVSFTEPVNNLNLSNFSLSSTGLGGTPVLVSISPSAGPAAGYTVTANSGPGTPSVNPTLRLNLSTTGTVRDAAGNLLAGPFPGETYTFDGSAPLVTLSRVNGITVSFPVTLTVNATSVAGTCGIAAGDSATVSVQITGPVTRNDSVTCTAGTWTDTVGLTGNGTYSVSASQADDAGNSGSSGSKTIIVNKPDTTAPVVTLTMLNGSTVVNGSTIAFPLTTDLQVTSIGGTCGTLPGDAAVVNVTLSGPTNRTGPATCSSGAWTFTLSPALLNSPAGVNDGDYTITVTQTDTASNIGTTGPKPLTLATRRFTVTGNAVTTLRPGTVSDLSLTLNNPYPFALQIETLTVTFAGVGSCNGPSNFTVSRAFAGPYRAEPGSRPVPINVAPQIKMLNLSVPQDGCKLASISLNYSGLASRA
jgi:Bacterial Ig-like domain